jgi:hypothetical protein
MQIEMVPTAVLLALLPVWAPGGELPSADVTLEVLAAPTPGRVPEGAPLRFALLEKGRVFVGGTSDIAVGQIEGGDRKQLEKMIEAVEKDDSYGSEVTLAPGPDRYRLHFGGRNRTIVASGDPRRASIAHRKLADLILRLERFEHASLRPHEPAEVLVSVRRGDLVGGCRSWGFEFPLEAAERRAVAIPTRAASGWPRGATPASVCHEGRRYVVALRPLVPGES